MSVIDMYLGYHDLAGLYTLKKVWVYQLAEGIRLMGGKRVKFITVTWPAVAYLPILSYCVSQREVTSAQTVFSTSRQSLLNITTLASSLTLTVNMVRTTFVVALACKYLLSHLVAVSALALTPNAAGAKDVGNEKGQQFTTGGR